MAEYRRRLLVGKRGNPLKQMSNRAGRNEREARNRHARNVCKIRDNGSIGFSTSIGATWKYSESLSAQGTVKLGRKKYLAQLRKHIWAVPVTDSRREAKKPV